MQPQDHTGLELSHLLCHHAPMATSPQALPSCCCPSWPCLLWIFPLNSLSRRKAQCKLYEFILTGWVALWSHLLKSGMCHTSCMLDRDQVQILLPSLARDPTTLDQLLGLSPFSSAHVHFLCLSYSVPAARSLTSPGFLCVGPWQNESQSSLPPRKPGL